MSITAILALLWFWAGACILTWWADLALRQALFAVIWCSVYAALIMGLPR